MTNVVNYFLGSESAAKVTTLAKSNDGKALEGYVHEALRKSSKLKVIIPRLIILCQVLTQLSEASSVSFTAFKIHAHQ